MSSLTPEQEGAAYAPCSVVVTAGAGTGKTHMLAQRYLYYLRDRDLSPLELVAVTFTEKAAAELRSRIRSLVSQQLPQRLDLLAELEAAQISTIHSLAARICQEHFQIINIPADFTVLDSLEGQVWLGNALKKALTRLTPTIFQTIPYSLLQDILDSLLADPHTANKAIKQGIQDWSQLIADARTQAVKIIVSDRLWQPTRTTLEQVQGNSGDKLEVIRLSVLEAMADLEAASNIDKAIATIDKVNLRVGSKKNWQGESMKTVKKALTDLRECVRRVIAQGLLSLELSDADEGLKSMIPAITEAYQEVNAYLSHLKLRNKVLTFSDLEIYALQALKHSQVQNYYQQRWQVFLVDEFQDTNPTQAELLNFLTAKAELTIVGDIKQSIYGFRRADIRIFQQFRERILKNQGKEVNLNVSFRTHHTLLDRLNQVFAPLLGDNRQDLTAFRQQAPNEGTRDTNKDCFQVLVIGDRFLQPGEEKPPKPSKSQRQQVEAYCLAAKIKQMLDNQTPVFDKQTRQTRPMEPKDIAILTRTWQPLGVYGEALASMGIPVVAGGGGNLLATREAKDASSLLRFLANPQDDIALVALLRSPFFAVSDRLLLEARNSFKQPEKNSCWWSELQSLKLAELEHPVRVLQQLIKYRQSETPSRILQIGDRLTGYTAVLANLAGAERKMADWQGFQELVKDLELGTYDLFGVVRRLKSLGDREVAVPRPVLNASNAVSLMTIFASKGLEWSLVIVADLDRERPKSSPNLYFDSQLGVAVKSKNNQGEIEKPVLYSWLAYLQEEKARDEAVRILYVALTRARDYLILSAAQAYKGELNRLQRGLTAAELSTITIPYTDAKAIPLLRPIPQVQSHLPPLLLNPVSSGLSELPVIALTEYARCPQRFKLHLIDGHPGIDEGYLKGNGSFESSDLASGIQIGTLVHKALEHNLTQTKDLLPFAEEGWSSEVLETAIALAKQFFRQPMYQYFRQTAIAKERQVSLQLGKLTFNGIVDLVGNDWILDYKSDRTPQPEDHRFQLWAYAQAMAYPNAHIVYLRHNRIYSFGQTNLEAIAPQANYLAEQIYRGNYTATATMEKCAICPYLAFCNDAII